MPHSRSIFFTRLFVLMAAVLCGCGSSSSIAFAQSSGDVNIYNVMDYYTSGGYTGGDYSYALQSALVDAVNAGGGIVYFPAGTYQINEQIPDATAASHMPALTQPTIAQAFNMTNITLRGDGVGATQIRIGPTSGTPYGSITLTANKSSVTPPGGGSYTFTYHAGLMEDLTVNCAQGETSGQTGLISVDSIGLKYHNVLFKNCGTALDMQNFDGVEEDPSKYPADQKGWHERNDLDNVTFYNNQTAIHFDLEHPGSGSGYQGSNSYGYNSFRIVVKTDSSTAKIFSATGEAYPYNSYYEVSGQITPGTIVFDGHYDGYMSPNQFSANTYIVRLDDLSGSGTSYVFNTTGGGAITGMSNVKVGPATSLAPSGNTNIFLTEINSTPVDLGIQSASSGTASVITDARIGASSACFVKPENSTAAGMMSATWVGSYAAGSATINKPSGAGAMFHLWCHP